MERVTEVFDVKQHPLRNGILSDLEKRVTAIEKRFSAIYERDQVHDSPGFKTEQGTRFRVNAIYEWNSVFLEYDEGEDGDMVSLEEDEETMFDMLNKEILIGELDEKMQAENEFRIFKAETVDGRMLIYFRFTAGRMSLKSLFEQNSRVVIDGCTYKYEPQEKYQRVVIDEIIDGELYDHWIRFEDGD